MAKWLTTSCGHCLLQHRHAQSAHPPQTRAKITPIVPSAGKLMGISTATVTTTPVDFSWLGAHSTAFPFFSSQFRAHFGFHKQFQDGLDCGTRRRFGLEMDGLQRLLALRSLSLSDGKRYTHEAEDSFWLGGLVSLNLLYQDGPPSVLFLRFSYPCHPPLEKDILS